MSGITLEERVAALEGRLAYDELEVQKVREHVEILGGGAVQVKAPGTAWGAVYVGGEQQPGLAMNAYLAPDGSSWNRYDTTRIASLLVLNLTGGLQFYTALPAANPIVWTTAGVSTGVASPITNGGTGLLPVIGIQAATAAQNGYLAAADFNKLHNYPLQRLAYAAGAADLLNGAAIAANTWTDVVPNQSFNNNSATGILLIVVRLGVFAILGAAAAELATKAVIDSATTNIPLKLWGGGANAAANAGLAGGPATYVGLAQGAHTIKVQIRGSAGFTAYCRANTVPETEFAAIEIWELQP